MAGHPLVPFPASAATQDGSGYRRRCAGGGGGSSSGAMAVDQAAGGVDERGEAPVQEGARAAAPLKHCWMEIYNPVYEHMKVDIRMNLKLRD
jgi:hypothetical protein